MFQSLNCRTTLQANLTEDPYQNPYVRGRLYPELPRQPVYLFLPNGQKTRRR